MTNTPTPTPTPKTLTRSDDRMIAGVCAGIAEYFGIDVTLVRVVTVLAVLLGFGAGILLYIAGWLIMPDRSGQTVITWRPAKDSLQTPQQPSQPTTQSQTQPQTVEPPAPPTTESPSGQADEANEPPAC